MQPHFANVSARTANVLAVLDGVLQAQPATSAQAVAARKQAQKELASRRGIEVTTVVAACTREQGWHANQFDYHLWRWYVAGEDSLRQQLRAHAARGHQPEDCRDIDEFISRPRLAAPAQGDVVAECPDAVVAELAGKRIHGTRLFTAEQRRAVKECAMDLAREVYAGVDWAVSKAHLPEAYDYRCTRQDEELHVIVKGTTDRGDSILLTSAEVEHARRFPNVELFFLSGIKFTRGPSGLRCLYDEENMSTRPLILTEDTLRPVCYEYRSG